jgi:uncharacterized protein YggE
MKMLLATVLVCCVSQVNAQQNASPLSSIRVTADAVAMGRPDRAEIDLGVVTQDKQSQNAAAQNTRQIDTVVTALRNLLGVDADIRTINRSLSPDYQYRPIGGKPAVSSYTAMNVVRVTVDDLEKVGATIDAATQAGANHVESVRYTVRDSQVLRSQALREATSKARSDAEALAGALNVRIIRILSADETADAGSGQPDLMSPDPRDPPGPAPSPAQPGSFIVTANVTLTLEVGAR